MNFECLLQNLLLLLLSLKQNLDISNILSFHMFNYNFHLEKQYAS